MLNKLQFNNLVITNKKQISKARAQAVAKLVQKLRKLKVAVEKQPDNEKHKQKMRKYVECLEQLKMLKRLDIMRSLLLQDDKRHAAVLTNGRATPDEIAIAMLGLNKIMQELVATFRESLKLSAAADAAWRTEILEASKRCVKEKRTEEKRRKRQEEKAQKAQALKRREWLDQNKPEESAATVEQAPIVMNEADEDHVIEEIQPVPKPIVKVLKVPKRSKGATGNKKLPVTNEQTQEATESTKKQEAKAEKKKNTKTKSEKLKHEKPKEDKEVKIRPTHVVDSFFMTKVGKPYLSSAVVQSDDSQSDTDEESYKPAHKYKATNRQQERKRQTQSLEQQKMPIAANFKGTKIKFGSDGTAVKTIVPAVVANPVPLVTKIEDGMHPSWIAKQKLKPKIAAFEGKKIKFDDA